MKKFIALIVCLLPVLVFAVSEEGGVCTAVADDGRVLQWGCVDATPAPPPPPPVEPPPVPVVNDWAVFNPADPSRLEVYWQDGTYTAHLKQDPDPQQTLWYADSEGRMDSQRLSGDFTMTLRGVSMDVIGRYQGEYQFVGLIVRVSPGNYEFAVFGNRGGNLNTIESKVTRNYYSRQSDIGNNAIPGGVVDLRVVRVGSQIDFYYSTGGEWILLPHNNLYATRLNTTADVDVGIITYGYSWPDEFVATVESVEVIQ